MLELMPGPQPPIVAECVHGITTFDGRGCEICTHGLAEEAPKITKPGKPKPPKAADLELAAAVAEGLICPLCEMPYDPVGGIKRHKADRDWRIPMGCDCQRKESHDRNMSVRDAWLSRPEVIDAYEGRDGKRTALAGMAFTSYNRSARRAAVTPDDREADRLDIIERHEVEPRWTAVRVNEADTLPV